MLNTSRVLTINGTSTTTEGEPIASMYCHIDQQSGMRSINNSVISETLYDKHKDIVRADIDAFTAFCREEEDKFLTSES